MPNSPITVRFDGGVQAPPKLGTLILKKTSADKMAYAQNVDTQNEEYGEGAVTPGPALTTIGSNSELTGVPFAKVFFGFSSLSISYLYFLQGILGTLTIIRRVKDLVSGSTPVIDTTGSMTADHGPSHANQSLIDMVLRPDSSGNNYAYVSGKDDTDTWVMKFDAASGTPALTDVATNPNFTGGYTAQFLVLCTDNIIYWIGQRRVSSIDTADTYVVSALANGLPLGTFATAGADWNGFLAVAVCNDASGDFTKRLSAGRAEICLWNRIDPNISKRVPAPFRYISVLKVDPSGGLLCFGGLDGGKTSIFEFTGFGFTHVFTYIGDLPRSHHSVEFDDQGRILWQTANGQLCRLDRTTGKFDHLGSGDVDSSAGGLLARALGSPGGNEFLMAYGKSTPAYTMKKVQFGNYVGDGAGADTIATPIAVSGIQQVPYNSTIKAITAHLPRPLAAGEKCILRVYTNGSSTPRNYLTLDYSVDGAKASKRLAKTLTKINSFSLDFIWKMTDGSTTAPAVLPAEVELV